MVWAIILAAGESKRMGRPKQLLPFNGKTILETVIEASLSSKTAHTVVVLGAARGKIANKITHYPVTTRINKQYRSGMLSSIKCGFRAVPRDANAVLVMLGDVPAITPEVINELIEAFEGSDKGVVVPVFHSKRGHPILVSNRYRQEVLSIEPSQSLRTLLHAHRDDILEVTVKTDGILFDIDTEEEYTRVLREYTAKKSK